MSLLLSIICLHATVDNDHIMVNIKLMSLLVSFGPPLMLMDAISGTIVDGRLAICQHNK